MTCPRVRVLDGGVAGVAGALADEDGARLGLRLHPARGVHDVARKERLVGRAEVDRRLAREDPGPCLEPGDARLLAEGGHGIDELERGAHGPLRVVLLNLADAPRCHHGVADELLDGAAVPPDHGASGVEVPGQQLAHVLRIALLGEGGEADEVGEEHRNVPPLGQPGTFGSHEQDRGRWRRGCGNPGGERRAALTAEGVALLIRGSTGDACQRKCGAALRAEAASGADLCSAGRAVHRQRSLLVREFRSGIRRRLPKSGKARMHHRRRRVAPVTVPLMRAPISGDPARRRASRAAPTALLPAR